MSILIKGMQMPKNCEECNFDAGGYCTAKSLNFLDWCNVNERPRPSWCPLVELPPHGRLIDADAFVKFINEHWDGYDQWFAGQLEARPTIIESEGEE